MHKRSDVKRRRRLQRRLATSVESLLRERLGLPLPEMQRQWHFPVRPTLTKEILRLLSLGALELDSDLDLTLLEEEREEQPDQEDTGTHPSCIAYQEGPFGNPLGTSGR